MTTMKNSKPCSRRSILFVSGLSATVFPEAINSGADIVCLDLEDAVPPGRKTEARATAEAVLQRPEREQHVQIALRINSLHSRDGLADILACLAQKNTALGAIVLPKIESADEVCMPGLEWCTLPRVPGLKRSIHHLPM
jgi:citrate lyase beta subunit